MSQETFRFEILQRKAISLVILKNGNVFDFFSFNKGAPFLRRVLYEE